MKRFMHGQYYVLRYHLYKGNLTDCFLTIFDSADITYVERSDFNIRIPCFNATEPEPEETSTPMPSSVPAENGQNGVSSDGGSSGLSGGAIAGIVIGCVVGVSLIGIILFFLYRRDQREKRLADRGLSGRNVKWDEDAASRSRTSGNAESDRNVQLQDLPSTRT